MVRCLSVRQPHADAIARGEKAEEYRTWPTRYRGPCLIAAGKTPDDRRASTKALPRGVFVALVEISDCTCEGEDDYSWHLKVLRRFKPPLVPHRGRLGLYEFPWPAELGKPPRSRGRMVAENPSPPDRHSPATGKTSTHTF
jgi:hypothetical protein